MTKFLFNDPDRDFQALARRLSDTFGGLEVTIVNTPAEAITQLSERGPFDFVISAVKFGGVDLLKHINEGGIRIPFIFYSGFLVREVMGTLREQEISPPPADHIFEKVRHDLIDVVRFAIDKYCPTSGAAPLADARQQHLDSGLKS